MTEIKAEIAALTRAKRARQPGSPLGDYIVRRARSPPPVILIAHKVFSHFIRPCASMRRRRADARSEITCIKAKQRNGSRNNNVCL